MGTIPPIPTFAAAENLTSAKLNQLAAATAFWADPPRCHAYRLAGFTYTTSTYQAVGWDQEVADTDGMHDVVTNNTRIICKTAGTYEFSGQIQYGSSATGVRAVQLRENAAGSDVGGTQIFLTTEGAVSGATTSVQFGPIDVTMSVNDYIEVFGYQTSGGNLSSTSGQQFTYVRTRLVSST